jgi:iron-sulfur cluster assembly accessory protein
MIVITPVAVAKIKEIMVQQNPVPAVLRIGVRGGGCSGFQYALEFDSQTRDTDEVLDFDGLKVAVDQMSAMYLEGVTLDYVETLEASGFKFDNPSVRSTCGCGQSFAY